MRCLRSVCKKPYIEGSRAITITKQTFNRCPMVFGWHVHKLREFIHDKGDIRPSHLEILGATNHLTVHGGIDRHCTIISSQGSTHDKQCGDRFGVEHVMLAKKINNILWLR